MWHVCLPGYHILHGAHCALDLKSIAIQFINELWDDTTCTYMYIALMRIQKNEEGLERTYGPFTVRAFLPACLPACADFRLARRPQRHSSLRPHT